MSHDLRRVLEIGTGDGDGTLEMALALPHDGLLITIEPDAARAARARQRFAAAGVAARVSVLVGEPARYLHKIAGPFDLVVDRSTRDAHERIRSRLMTLLKDGGQLLTPNTTS